MAPRIVASGGGSRVTAWMAAVADATELPVDAVAVPDGAALGAAYFARLAAGLETSLNDSSRWAAVGRRIEPDPAWVRAADSRYAILRAGHRRRRPVLPAVGREGHLERAAVVLPGDRLEGVPPLFSAKRWVSIGVMSSRPSATSWR